MPRTKLKKRKDGRYRKVYAGIPFYVLIEKEVIDMSNAYKRDLEAGNGVTKETHNTSAGADIHIVGEADFYRMIGLDSWRSQEGIF